MQNQDINAVAISGDGSRVVAGTFFLNIAAGGMTQMVGFFTRDAAGGQVPATNAGHMFQATAPPLIGQQTWSRGGIVSVAISRDGTWAAAAGGMTPATANPPNAGFIYTYDIATGNNVPLYIAGSEVRAVAISNDGKYLVAGADKVYVYRRNGTTWTPLPLPNLNPVGGPVRRVSISGNGEWIVAAVDGGIVGLIHNDTATGTLDASGKWALPQPPPNPNLPYYFVQAVAAADGGSAFAAAAANGRLYYFDTGNVVQQPGGTLTFAPSWSRKLAGCPTCRWAAISDDGLLVTGIGAVGKTVNPARPGRVVLYRHNNNATPTKVWSGIVRTLDGPNSVSIDARGSFVAVADGTPYQARGGFYLFDGASGASRWSTATSPDNFPTADMNYAIALSADGTAAVGGSNDGNMYYFSVP